MGAFGDPRVPDMKHAADILLGRALPARPLRQLPAGALPRRPALPAEGLLGRRTSTSSSSARTPRAPTSGAGGTSRRARPTRSRSRRTSRRARASSASSATPSSTRGPGGRSRVVMSDKSNAMRFVGDLWQRAFAEVAREYPDIEAVPPLHRRPLHADGQGSAAVRRDRHEQHVRRHRDGPGRRAPGRPRHGRLGQHPSRAASSMFEPVHGSAPKYAGTGRANPFGAILTAALLLEHLGHAAEAAAVEPAVARLRARRGGARPTSAAPSRRRRPATPSVERLDSTDLPGARPWYNSTHSEGDQAHGDSDSPQTRLLPSPPPFCCLLGLRRSGRAASPSSAPTTRRRKTSRRSSSPTTTSSTQGKDADWVYFPKGSLKKYKTVMVKDFERTAGPRGHGRRPGRQGVHGAVARDGRLQDRREGRGARRRGQRLQRLGAERRRPFWGGWMANPGVGARGAAQGHERQGRRRDPPQGQGLHDPGRGRERSRGRVQGHRGRASRAGDRTGRPKPLLLNSLGSRRGGPPGPGPAFCCPRRGSVISTAARSSTDSRPESRRHPARCRTYRPFRNRRRKPEGHRGGLRCPAAARGNEVSVVGEGESRGRRPAAPRRASPTCWPGDTR